ncbi:hypothetical protein [Stutzerimonas stutzeri]|uniref:Uncharacterized protein n=1 Tax=Stutzerimonas stutzeri KOS6 TaxID=1218352 RepID=A0A061JVK7_STUST|nr:hypothetical protein [Stutzerimonas stutzeri]EWC42640.1 hypothetical protein B597_004315 [Stutzerimonas stutzeri KOS6]
MELALILAMMILGWISVALAMLWGMLRIARRHPPRQRIIQPPHGTIGPVEPPSSCRA